MLHDLEVAAPRLARFFFAPDCQSDSIPLALQPAHRHQGGIAAMSGFGESTEVTILSEGTLLVRDPIVNGPLRLSMPMSEHMYVGTGH